MDLIISLFPIVLLIVLMTKKKSVPSSIALPVTALLTYFISMIYFKAEPLLVHATLIKGLLTALTPILIIWGAIFLFKTLETSGSMKTIRDWLNNVSPNKVAQLMIVGWAFPFLVEGASGFGTPAALAAPILVGLGFSPIKAAMLTLIMNSVPVSFGAVGTPTWFGFSGITSLGAAEITSIGIKSAAIHSVAALVIPIIALAFVVDRKTIRKNLGFILISVMACVIPYFILSFFSYEFPSLVGGAIGLPLSVLAARMGWGLDKSQTDEAKLEQKTVRSGSLLRSLFPLWGTVLLLVITRIPQLGIKGLLTLKEPFVSAGLGTLGDFLISPSLTVSLKEILRTGESWSIQLLYVPSIIPFFLVSFISFLVFRMKKDKITQVWRESAHQMKGPVAALLGALVFVGLLMMGGEKAPTMIIGSSLAQGLGGFWKYTATYLGALGSFFSGSNTISNLMFGPIQDSIATRLNLDRTTILAMQSVGGAMGNMVCINNIVAVSSVLGLVKSEGKILKTTVIPMLVYGVIAALVSVFM